MPKKKKVRVGVIGAGGISQVSHIPNLASDPNAELAAICDIDSGRAATVALRHKVPDWFDDAETMINNCPLDAVMIATPTVHHLPLGQLALERGLDVLIEKPFARNAIEGRLLVETAHKNNRILMAAMNHRFREDALHLKKLLQDGSIGDLVMVRSGWLKRLGVWGRPYWFMEPNISGGGVLMDLGLQMIDLILFLLDYPQVVEVNCGMSSDILGLEVEDTATAFIRFDNGVTFILAVSWAECIDNDLAYTYFSGSHGAASLNPLRITKRQMDQIVRLQPPILSDEMKLYVNSFKAEISHFINAIQDRSPVISSGKDALAALDIIDRLYVSAGR